MGDFKVVTTNYLETLLKATKEIELIGAKEKWKTTINDPTVTVANFPHVYLSSKGAGLFSTECFLCEAESPCMLVDYCGLCEQCGKAIIGID